MANHKSALKRTRQNIQRRTRNRSRKTRIKNLVKAVEASIAANAPEEAQERLRQAQKMIDRFAGKGAFHRRTAARKISRLTRRVGSLTVVQEG